MDTLKCGTTNGLQIVDVIYRRIDDTFMDPEAFNPDSLIGIPGIFEVYKKGRVALANAPGTGVADDKVVYAYVPRIIKYYLGEEAMIPNVKTYICGEEEDFNYVIENIAQLVVKEANEAGGYGMLIGPKATEEEHELFREKIRANPRNYIAQQPFLYQGYRAWWMATRKEGMWICVRTFYMATISVLFREV